MIELVNNFCTISLDRDPPIQHGELYQASSSLPTGIKTLTLEKTEKKISVPYWNPEVEF